jgi:hypothetical protein
MLTADDAFIVILDDRAHLVRRRAGGRMAGATPVPVAGFQPYRGR